MVLTLETGQDAVQDSIKDKADRLEESLPPAGPHDRPELTNYDACPGCGMFPSQQQGKGSESDPAGG
jgi:hypothetical protein